MIYHVIHIWYRNNENSIQHNYRAMSAYVEVSKADLCILDNPKSEKIKILKKLCIFCWSCFLYHNIIIETDDEK